MNRFDRFVFGFLFGAIPPVFFFLAFWWGTFKFVPEKYIFLFAAAGLIFGLILDFLISRKFKKSIFDIKIVIPVLAFLFYSVCIYGFFMGVPLFNLAMGIFAGRYCAIRVNRNKEREYPVNRQMKYCALFSSFVIFLFGAASAVLALRFTNTPLELKKMFGLSYDITWAFVWVVILAGGALMVASEYLLTYFVFKKSLKKS